MVPLPGAVKARVKTALLKRWGFEPTCQFADMSRLLAGKVSSVVDGGACWGTAAKEFRSIFPNASIYCFEPIPANLAKLREVPGISVVPFALAEKSGPVTLNVNATPGGHSLLKMSDDANDHFPVNVQHVDTLQIESVSLDDWSAKTNVQVDVIKLDIQGAELSALRGAEQTLKNCQAVLTELHFLPVYEGAPVADEIWSFLKARGFRLYRFYDTWCNAQGQLVQGDGLFIRERWVPS